MIEFLVLTLNEGEMLIHQKRDQLVVSVVKTCGECIVGTNSCYGFGKDGHMVKDCPNVRSQGKGNSQA